MDRCDIRGNASVSLAPPPPPPRLHLNPHRSLRPPSLPVSDEGGGEQKTPSPAFKTSSRKPLKHHKEKHGGTAAATGPRPPLHRTNSKTRGRMGHLSFRMFPNRIKGKIHHHLFSFHSTHSEISLIRNAENYSA